MTTAFVKQPTNPNYLISTAFSLTITKIPKTTWFCTEVNVPGIDAGAIDFPTPLRLVPISPDSLTYHEFSVNFIIDEDMTNWIELFNWIRGITFSENTNQYRDLAEAGTVMNPRTGTIFSDGTLIIQTDKLNPNLRIIFKDLQPLSLSDIPFSTADVDGTNPLIGSVAFRYEQYNIEKI